MAARSFLTPLIDLMFPPRCPLCGEALAEQGGLCLACWSELAIPGEPACTRCQRPLPERVAQAAPEGRPVCAPCLASPPLHEGIAAATLYNAISRDLVLQFKHGRRIALAGLLGQMMAARLPRLEGDWLVVPVPLHRWRLWQRGYNQSALLAERVARITGQRLVVDALVRTRRTPSLGGLNRRARAEALQGAILPDPRRIGLLQGANVLLVDDVLTSGATTDACLRALRRAKAARIRIVCFARVIDEALDDTRQRGTKKRPEP